MEPDEQLAVADFGGIAVRAATATLARAAAKPVAQFPHARLNLVSSGNQKNVLATAGPLSKAGNAFTETWVNGGPR